jgi:outer membrane protein
MNNSIRYLISGILGLVLLLASSDLAAQNVRIGYVNSQRVLMQAPGSGAAQDTLERIMGRFEAEIDTLQADLERRRLDLERQSATLSAAARQQRQQDLQQRFESFQRRVGEIEEIAQQRRQTLLEPIMRNMRVAMEDVRREGGFAMILDFSTGVIAAADPALDVTDRVLARLRQMGAPTAR